jgi:hypothetical protein
VFVSDAMVPLTSADRVAVGLLRKTKKPVLFAANKSDSPRNDADAFEIYRLGVEKVYPVSGLHGRGIGELEAAIVEAMPAKKETPDIDGRLPRISIVGRPNAGKSTLTNALVGTKVAITSNRPQTTRHSVRGIVHRPDAQLVLVGYGPLEHELRACVERAAVPGVVFAGHVPLANLPRYYVAADCLALPSHEEVWGLVLNEAAACGLPLVTTEAVGAGPDVVEPGLNGCIVPPAAPDRLAAALLEVLGHSTNMGEASRKVMSKLTYDQNVTAVMEAIAIAMRRRESDE